MKKYFELSVLLVVFVGVITGCATTSKGLTEEEIITQRIVEGIEAIKAKDDAKFAASVSESFYSPIIGDREDLLAFIKNADSTGFLDGLEVDLSEAVIEIEGDKGSVSPIWASGAFGNLNLSFEGAKENGVWMITGLDAY